MNTRRLLNLPKQLSTLVLLFPVLRTPTDHKFKPTREELKSTCTQHKNTDVSNRTLEEKLGTTFKINLVTLATQAKSPVSGVVCKDNVCKNEYPCPSPVFTERCGKSIYNFTALAKTMSAEMSLHVLALYSWKGEESQLMTLLLLKRQRLQN